MSADADSAFVRAQNRFGWNLLREIAKNHARENILLSPLSLALSLAMVYNGAAGETREEIAATLSLEASDFETVNRSAAALRKALRKTGKRITLAIANGLWADAGLALASDFLQRVVSAYEAEVKELDLNSSSAVDLINEWVSRKTRGKIDSIVSDRDLTPPVDCVLTNAIYFKGFWWVPFDKTATSRQAFHAADGQTLDVPMMSRSSHYENLEEPRFQAVRLPYVGGDFAMYVYLPAAELPLTDLLEDLAADGLQDSISRFEGTPLDLSLPRFFMVYDGELREPLSHLGMEKAFHLGADLSAMGPGQRFISAVKHKARAEVTEEGTEAAAAAAVVMTRGYAPPRSMVVDRPFLFVIRDDASGAILFLGAVMKPEEAA